MMKNSFFMLMSLFTKLLTNLVIFFLFARIWGVDTFGWFMYFYTIATLLVIVVDYGFPIKLVKEISRNPNELIKIVSISFYSKLFITIFIIILSCIYVISSNEDGKILGVFMIILITLIFNSFSIFFNIPFRALNSFKLETVISLVGNLVYILITFILLYLNSQPIVISLGLLIGRILSFYLSFKLFSKKIGKVDISFEFARNNSKEIFNNIRENSPYAVHLAIGVLYLQIDTIVIKQLLDNEAVGIYQSGMRILIGALIFADVITNVYLPKLSKVTFNKELFIDLGVNITRYSILIGSIGTIILFILAKPIILLLYGEEFLKTIPLVQMFSILLIVRYFGVSYGAMLTTMDRQKTRAIAVCFALIVNILLNMFLIPALGLSGAVISGILTSLILNLIYITIIGRELKNILLNKNSIGVLLIILVSMFLHYYFVQDFIMGIIAIFVTVTLLLIVGLEKKEWRKILQK